MLSSTLRTIAVSAVAAFSVAVAAGPTTPDAHAQVYRPDRIKAHLQLCADLKLIADTDREEAYRAKARGDMAGYNKWIAAANAATADAWKQGCGWATRTASVSTSTPSVLPSQLGS